MAVPKKKKSYSRTRQGRAHHALSSRKPIVDKHTGEYVLPHHVNRKDGTYKGEQILDNAD